MATENPFDMNQAMKAMVKTELGEMMPLLAAQATLIAGNALRAQAFGMTAAINPGDFIVQPAKLDDGGCIVLLRNLKHVPNTYRLLVAPAYTEDDTTVVGRAIIIFAEDENDLVKTQYVNVSKEAKDELNRQLKVIGLEEAGTLELCLVVVTEPIEGYEYFVDPDAPKPLENVEEVQNIQAPAEPTPAAT